jgi:arylsulfatase A
LYNLKDDPGETNNLAKSKPELAAKLRGEMDEWQNETRAPIPTVLNPEYDLSGKP